MVRRRKSCELTTGVFMYQNYAKAPPNLLHLPILLECGVLTSSKGLPRRTWVESTMLGCMATADLLWKGLERDIFLAYTGEKMVKTEESGNIDMEIHQNPMENTAFNRVSQLHPLTFRNQDARKTVSWNGQLQRMSWYRMTPALGVQVKELAISAS